MDSFRVEREIYLLLMNVAKRTPKLELIENKKEEDSIVVRLVDSPIQLTSDVVATRKLIHSYNLEDYRPKFSINTNLLRKQEDLLFDKLIPIYKNEV